MAVTVGMRATVGYQHFLLATKGTETFWFQLLLALSIRCKLFLAQGHVMGAEVKESLTQERSIAPISIGTLGYQHRTEPYCLFSEGGGVSPRACLPLRALASTGAAR